MDAADVAWLRTEAGARATDAVAELRAGGRTELSVLRALAREWSPPQARAALALVEGRAAAAAKLPDADRLFCDRDAAEQASDARVAGHLAQRFKELGFAGARRVADLGCGMGGDALAIAVHAPVLAVDRDPARLAMLAANAEARGLAARLELCAADLATWTPPADVDAIWADPARRSERGRELLPERWSPPLARVLELARGVAGAGVKLAPGVALDALPPLDTRNTELEFVSLERGLRAAVLWLGTLARSARTATVLPAGASLARDADIAPLASTLRAPGRYLYDPDPAIGRAGLVAELGAQLGAWQLDARIAYLSSDVAVDTPFARRLAVRACLPFAERAIANALHAAGARRVEVARRGSPVDTNALERRLNAALRARADGPVLVVVLTRMREAHVALVCERA